MLLSIRLVFLLVITAPVMFLSTELFEGFSHTTQWSVFMQGDYEEQWKAVDKAMDEGLPKTALEMVEIIYARAKKENNRPQIIKAISYRVALRAVTSEEDEVILIDDLEKEIAAAKQPVKAILTSMLADLYWGYYQQNRWRIHERTQVEDAPGNDFRTWDASVFFDTTSALYLRALDAAEQLKRTPVAQYRDILYRGSNSAHYRPTMYDILAHRALDFFRNDETDLPSPQQDFELSGLEALQPLDAFLRTSFESPNPNNPKYNAILLYQDLLRFHQDRGGIDATLDELAGEPAVPGPLVFLPEPPADPRAHLLGRCLGERQHEHVQHVRTQRRIGDDPHAPARQHCRLARARRRRDQHVGAVGRDRPPLLVGPLNLLLARHDVTGPPITSSLPLASRKR